MQGPRRNEALPTEGRRSRRAMRQHQTRSWWDELKAALRAPGQGRGRDAGPGGSHTFRRLVVVLEEVITREHQKWRVWQTLRRLRVGERALVVLRYLEELTHEEIAQIFRISTKTVERRLARAEAKFCTAYERCQSHAIPQR